MHIGASWFGNPVFLCGLRCILWDYVFCKACTSASGSCVADDICSTVRFICRRFRAVPIFASCAPSVMPAIRPSRLPSSRASNRSSSIVCCHVMYCFLHRAFFFARSTFSSSWTEKSLFAIVMRSAKFVFRKAGDWYILMLVLRSVHRQASAAQSPRHCHARL